MIVRALCTSCLQPYNLILQQDEMSLVKQVAVFENGRAKCPRLCGGFINVLGLENEIIAEGDVQLRDPITLTGKQLYQAINGMGLPDELPKDITVVRALLQGDTVDSYFIEEIDGRIYMHEIHMSGGAVIHLSAGPRGAMVLKVTKEKTDGSEDHR